MSSWAFVCCSGCQVALLLSLGACDISSLPSELLAVRVSCSRVRWRTQVSRSSIILTFPVGRHQPYHDWMTNKARVILFSLLTRQARWKHHGYIMCEQKCKCFHRHSNECCHRRTLNCIQTGTWWDVERQNHLVLFQLFPSSCWMLHWLCLIWNDSFSYLHGKSVELLKI